MKQKVIVIMVVVVIFQGSCHVKEETTAFISENFGIEMKFVYTHKGDRLLSQMRKGSSFMSLLE